MKGPFLAGVETGRVPPAQRRPIAGRPGAGVVGPGDVEDRESRAWGSEPLRRSRG
jgi:hypothetical protein